MRLAALFREASWEVSSSFSSVPTTSLGSERFQGEKLSRTTAVITPLSAKKKPQLETESRDLHTYTSVFTGA